MLLIQYKQTIALDEKTEVHKAKFLCFFVLKETHQTSFRIYEIIEMFENAGYCKPNTTRLRKNLLNNRIFKETKNVFTFVPAILQELDRDYGYIWDNDEKIESNSEVLDEKKFCTNTKFIDHLVIQINASYRNNCFDACAVLMRRLFEIMLIMTYRKLGIDSMIKDSNGNYFLLDKIISNAVNNKMLMLSRITCRYSDFQKTGNFSAHRIEYVGSKSDIDRILIDYRAALEELFIKAGY
jgi:hypothetical protein